MMARLHVDLFLQDKLLLNGVHVKIRLVRSKYAFSLMADGQNPDYKVRIVEATLFARKAALSPIVQMAHIKALAKGTAKYPLRPVDCKVYSIPQGAMSHTHENLFLETLPKRPILCCIDNEAYNGNYPKNPFNAKNNAINFLAVYVDGLQCWPNHSSQTSRMGATFEATSTCSPPPVNMPRTKVTNLRLTTSVAATPSSLSV